MITAETYIWAPPVGMLSGVANSWRQFYRDAHRKYGLSPVQYRDLYVAQHGCCYICRKAKGMNPDDPKGRGGRRLGVDHNHLTGDVRGLLCTGGDRTCNRIIGWLNVHSMERAVQYVRQEPAQVVLRCQVLPASGPDRDQVVRALMGLK